MKLNAYISGPRLDTLRERVAEEGVSMSEWITEAINMRLGLTDPEPRAPKQEDPGYENLQQKSLALPRKWWIDLGVKSDEEGYPSMMGMIREWVREKMGYPVPPPRQPRAPRRPDLTRDMMIEEHEAQFNEMKEHKERLRRLRSEGKLPEDAPIWERIRLGPETFFAVNLCRVPGCRQEDIGLHKHPGKHLAEYADAIEAGGRT